MYNGDGTNYEGALSRAHEALVQCGYSTNAKAMIFLSDGKPTVYINGNDDITTVMRNLIISLSRLNTTLILTNCMRSIRRFMMRPPAGMMCTRRNWRNAGIGAEKGDFTAPCVHY